MEQTCLDITGQPTEGSFLFSIIRPEAWERAYRPEMKAGIAPILDTYSTSQFLTWIFII